MPRNGGILENITITRRGKKGTENRPIRQFDEVRMPIVPGVSINVYGFVQLRPPLTERILMARPPRGASIPVGIPSCYHFLFFFGGTRKGVGGYACQYPAGKPTSIVAFRRRNGDFQPTNPSYPGNRSG